MNQNEPIFLNLYIRDTENHCKNTKNVGNKQIMRVKKINIILRKSTFFQFSFRTQSPKSLIERKFFRFLCLLCRDSEERSEIRTFNMAFI